jgi:hypothetical protein
VIKRSNLREQLIVDPVKKRTEIRIQLRLESSYYVAEEEKTPEAIESIKLKMIAGASRLIYGEVQDELNRLLDIVSSDDKKALVDQIFKIKSMCVIDGTARPAE